MAGGRFEVALEPVAAPASYGLEQVEFRVASHPKQAPGPLARVASGGELSRIALALQVVASEAGAVPTLVFDEVDSGIGGAVAATVGAPAADAGRAAAGAMRHAPAASGRVRGRALSRHQDQPRRTAWRATSRSSTARDRVEELARMLGGAEVTTKTRAHAKELLRAASAGQRL